MSIQVEGPTRKWKPVLYPYQGTNEPEWYAVAEWQPEVVLFFFLLWLCWKIPGRLVFTSLRHLLPKSNATVARLEWKRKTHPNPTDLPYFFLNTGLLRIISVSPDAGPGRKKEISPHYCASPRNIWERPTSRRGRCTRGVFLFFLLISLTPLLEGTVYLRIAFHKY